jgi:hypothetical protein
VRAAVSARPPTTWSSCREAPPRSAAAGSQQAPAGPASPVQGPGHAVQEGVEEVSVSIACRMWETCSRPRGGLAPVSWESCSRPMEVLPPFPGSPAPVPKEVLPPILGVLLPMGCSPSLC